MTDNVTPLSPWTASMGDSGGGCLWFGVARSGVALAFPMCMSGKASHAVLSMAARFSCSARIAGTPLKMNSASAGVISA